MASREIHAAGLRLLRRAWVIGAVPAEAGLLEKELENVEDRLADTCEPDGSRAWTASDQLAWDRYQHAAEQDARANELVIQARTRAGMWAPYRLDPEAARVTYLGWRREQP